MNKFVGSLLIISGTAIGAGMLALPLVTARAGFLPSAMVFVLCWMMMTASAFLLLEVNLASPPQSNLFSMAKLYLGSWGKYLTWFNFLLLLYALNAAYITGGAPWVGVFFTSLFNVTTSEALNVCIFSGILALIIAFGLRSVDLCNRFLMFGLAGIFLVFVGYALPHVQRETLMAGSHFSQVFPALPVLLTAFGYHIVIPSLVPYLNYDKRTLMRCLWIGSTVPLLIYLIWELIIFGVLPTQGSNSLIAITALPYGVKALTHAVAEQIHFPFFSILMNALSILVLVTSILGVSMSLVHFLEDAFKKYSVPVGIIIPFAFIPSLLFALYFPEGFTYALGFAGIFVAILLGILPILMAYKGRKNKQIAHLLVPGGTITLGFMLLFFILIILIEIYFSHL